MAELEILYGINAPSNDGFTYYEYHLAQKPATRWQDYPIKGFKFSHILHINQDWY
jgi:hypothetical protein